MNRRILRASTTGRSRSGRSAFTVKLPSIFRPAVSSANKGTDTVKSSVKSEASSHGPGIFYLLFICLCLAGSAGAVLYHLHVRFEGVRLGYQVSEHRKIQTKLMLQRRELRLELASMKEPGRIEDEAREKLGMESPKAEEFVHINRTKKVVSVSGGAL